MEIFMSQISHVLEIITLLIAISPCSNRSLLKQGQTVITIARFAHTLLIKSHWAS